MTIHHELWSQVREENPLVHTITNIVVANFSANGLLAIGASPIMADTPDEMEDIASIASSVVLNIGTLNPTTVEAMVRAGKKANERGIPVVLDPVGVGASTFRKQVVNRLMKEIQISVVRGNIGELATMAGVEWEAKGVDAGTGAESPEFIAMTVANTYSTIVAMTGEVDIVTDGKVLYTVQNGDPMMPLITGSGCLLSAVVGAFVGVAPTVPLLTKVTTALAVYGAVGEKAAQTCDAPGSFAVAFLDACYREDMETIASQLRVKEAVR